MAGVSAPYATAMADDAQLREAFLQCDVLIPDGQGFAWACRLLDVPCGERLAIPDLCERLLEEGQRRGWKVFIYGATEEVNRQACANVARRFPALGGVAGQHGYGQGQAEEDAVAARLKNEGFHLLIVARPSPDKEKFLARCCREAGVVGLAAGGYADVLAGKTRRAPALVQAVGLEWLYRVIQEPLRLWKRIGWANARFAAAALWAHLRMAARRPPWACPAVQVAAIVLAVCAAYSGSLNVPYHFDDPEYILDNPTIRSFGGLRDIKVLSFRKVWWLSNAICYRLSLLYGNHIKYKPDVRIFHAWNIACHLIAALALYGLLRRALRAGAPGSSLQPRPSGDGPRLEAGTPYDLAAAAAATIFAAHPLCTEAVTYICGRDNGQGGMFYLLGLYAAALTFERMVSEPRASASGIGPAGRLAPPILTVAAPSGPPLRWPAWFWPAVWTMILGACAVLTKESHLTFPGAVALVYLFFYRGVRRHTVSSGLLLGIIAAMAVLVWGAAGRREGRLGLALQAMLLLIAAGAVLGRGFRGHDPDFQTAGQSWTPAGLGVMSPESFLRRRVNLNWALLASVVGLGIAAVAAFPYAYERTLGALTGSSDSDYVRSLCSQAYAVPWMLLRAIVPYGLNIDHDFPTIADPHDPRAVTGCAVIFLLLLFGAAGAWRRWLGGFGVLLALLSIAPTNTVIERGDIVSERNFYLVAAGGACLIAWLLAALMSWIAKLAEARARKPAPSGSAGAASSDILRESGLWTAVLGYCLAAPFASFTVLRNNEWNDAFRLWDSARRRSPEKLRVLYNYGIAAAALKLYDQADTAFSNAIKIGEAKAEKRLFRPDESVQVMCFHLAYAHLANLQVRRYMVNPDKGSSAQIKTIDDIYRRGLERTAWDPDLAYTYGDFLLQLGRASDAVDVLQHSLNLHEWAEDLYLPLGLASLETNRLVEARAHFLRAAGVQEHHSLGVSWEQPAAKRAQIYAFLGLTKLLLKERVEGKNDLRKSLELDPQGVLVMLGTANRARNSKLKPVEMSQPDSLVITLSVTRRGVLEVLLQSCDEALEAAPERQQTVLRMLRGVVDNELRRRGAYQKKRIQFGFMDDPEAE